LKRREEKKREEKRREEKRREEKRKDETRRMITYLKGRHMGPCFSEVVEKTAKKRGMK